MHRLHEVFTRNIINENYDVEQMCIDLGLSRTQLFKKVKAASQSTPTIYLRKMRLEQARHLLLSTSQTISEIAYSVGFKDPNYFSRVFTKEFGISPKRMREG